MDNFKVYVYVESTYDIQADTAYEVCRDVLRNTYVESHTDHNLYNKATCMVACSDKTLIDFTDIKKEFAELETELITKSLFFQTQKDAQTDAAAKASIEVSYHTTMANYHIHKTGSLYYNKKQILAFISDTTLEPDFLNADDFIRRVKGSVGGFYYIFQY